MRIARAMVMGWAIHFQQESRNPFFLWIVICTPLISTMACLPFRRGPSSSLPPWPRGRRGSVAHDDGRCGANLVYFPMLLVCGVNLANGDLPGWLP